MNYWKDRNVIYEKPLPLFGNLWPVFSGKLTHSDCIRNIYKNYPNERYVGIFNFAPTLLIRDPELIKTIMVKEFQTFPEHRPFLTNDFDPLWNSNIFAIKDHQKWQKLRSTISPFFSTTKMRNMLPLMKQCSKQLLQHHLEKGDYIEVELKTMFTKFANDVIARTAFGVTCDSFLNPDNEFYNMARELNNLVGVKKYTLTVNSFAKIAKYLNIPLFSVKASKFFRKIIKQSIKLRREHGWVRPDILYLLMEAQSKKHFPETGFAAVRESELGKMHDNQMYDIDDETITAQAMIIIFAGSSTASTAMSYVLYELALNPDVQEKLREEVNDTLEKYNYDLTYESLIGMKYLDMVITETLRKWPPFIVLDRASVKPFTIEPKNPGEPVLHLDEGSVVIYSLKSLHMDPKYYPNPDKFDPERFSEENSDKIHPYTYAPFGIGPRSCIGPRFALIESKHIISEIISKFEIVTVPKTMVSMVMSKTYIFPIPDEEVKMLRNKHLKLQAQQVIMNVLHYFERERDNGGACVPFTSVMQRTAEACGISDRTLTSIKKKFRDAAPNQPEKQSEIIRG
ncbi:hypothetical protein FQA39_LY16033 [Lamprigera yunnana]|nr:hypothetical protein FQA39_LY16033 [Lamprigera yunnana]